VAPSELLNVPELHLVHWLVPVLPLKVPTLQSVQA